MTQMNVYSKKRAAAGAANGSNPFVAKKGRRMSGVQDQLVNRALEGLYHGGRTSGGGRGRSGRGRGRGFR